MDILKTYIALNGDKNLGSLTKGQTNRPGAKAIPASSTPTQRPGVIDSVLQKGKAITGQTLDIGASIGKAAGKFAVNTAKDIYQAAEGTYYASNPNIARVRQQLVTKSQQALDAKQSTLTQAYKAGKISRENYHLALKDISKSYQDLSKQSQENARLSDPKKLITDIGDTAINILAGGSVGLVRGGTKQVASTGINKLLDDAALKIEDAIKKVPSVTPLLERNAAASATRQAQKLAGETFIQQLTRDGKQVAIGLLIKRPIFYQTNIGGAQDVYNHILEGKYDDAAKESAWLATQMLNGGPIGAVTKGFKWLGSTGGKLAYGQGSFIDELSKKIGTGNANQIADYLNHLPKGSPEFQKAEKVLRIVQETNLRMTKNNARDAAERVLGHWSDSGIDLMNVKPKDVVELFQNWAIANETLNTLAKSGKLQGIKPEDAAKYVVVRWDVNTKNALAQQFEASNPQDVQEIVNIYQRWLNSNAPATNNFLLKRKIENIMREAVNGSTRSDNIGQKIAEEIRGISAVSVLPKGIPAQYQKKFEKLGYTVAQPFEANKKMVTPNVSYDDTRKLVTSAVKGDTDVFTSGALPNPTVSSIANAFESMGLSPRSSTELATKQLSQQVAANLANTEAAKTVGLSLKYGDDLDNGGRVILSKLQTYVDEKQPSKVLNYGLVAGRAPGPAITDIRQLTVPEIREALGVATREAHQVQRAVLKGYLDTPLDMRGLGDKVVDTLYYINPLQKYYSRIQSALRYTYNPFFRFQESVETKILSKAQARTILWNKSKDQLDEGARILDDSGLFKTGLSGEAAQDLTLGRITATITPAQKRNIAGLAYKMAEAKGLPLDQFIRDYGDEVGDALRIIVQYPNKGVLNSSLARTMNIAFFPIRYNAKVTKLAAEVLAREAPSVQLAVVNSLLSMKSWLQSDEGIRWRKEHNDALSVLEWATPINSIQYWVKLLTGGKENAPANLGSLGGLPLGVITQILDSQGIINLNTPYVNPTTGDVLPKYIPETAKAKAASAITDLLGSMFTYPGRILGLPGKQQTLNKLAKEVTGASGIDWEKVDQTERLTPQQQNMIRVLKGDTSDEAQDALYSSPAPGQFNWYTLPPLSVPVKPMSAPPTRVQQRKNLPTKAELKAAKKKQKTRPQAIPTR